MLAHKEQWRNQTRRVLNERGGLVHSGKADTRYEKKVRGINSEVDELRTIKLELQIFEEEELRLVCCDR